MTEGEEMAGTTEEHEMTGMTDDHDMISGAAAAPKDRPRVLVLGGFLSLNALVLAAAALVRRRDRRAPDRRRPTIRTETSQR